MLLLYAVPILMLAGFFLDGTDGSGDGPAAEPDAEPDAEPEVDTGAEMPPEGGVRIELTEDAPSFVGTDADEDVLGTAIADRIDTAGGDDTIDGGDGADLLRGGTGDDLVDAGAGDDLVDAGPGDDRVDLGPGDDILGFDDLTEDTDGDDVVRGGAGDDLIDDDMGRNAIHGDAGDDILSGIDAADEAEITEDTLFGGDGDDTLFGDLGDVLFGEGGIDTFVVTQAAGADGTPATLVQIEDFEPGIDALVLDVIDDLAIEPDEFDLTDSTREEADGTITPGTLVSFDRVDIAFIADVAPGDVGPVAVFGADGPFV